MPALSSSRFLGLYAVLKYCFIEPHTFSMGFKSGDSGEDGHHSTLFLSKKSSIALLACLGSWSWNNLCPSGNFSWMNGRRPAPRINFNFSAFIMPLNIITFVAPREEIPPQICSLMGCFGRGFNFLGCSCFLKQTLECCSS